MMAGAGALAFPSLVHPGFVHFPFPKQSLFPNATLGIWNSQVPSPGAGEVAALKVSCLAQQTG